jgi:riboflavin kinase/FMN adenylyltransferase
MAVVSLRVNQHPPGVVTEGVVAIGNFDGVHRGHQALIDVAKRVGDRVIPVTFDPHPLKLLSPERYQPPLTTMAERTRLLHEIGAEHVVVLETSPELLGLTPREFFEKVIIDSLKARGVVEGFNFRFGHDRAGSNETLRTLCRETGLEFREVPAFEDDGRPVSSSRVRDAIQAGDANSATELLGRPYRITGIVGYGAMRGRTIGFPTANLQDVETIVPAIGVYAVHATTAEGMFAGAANIGPNPTFGEDARKIEVHLIDFTGDLYGKRLDVDFVARLRDTKKFESVDALIEQMRRDIGQARRSLSSKGEPAA